MKKKPLMRAEIVSYSTSVTPAVQLTEPATLFAAATSLADCSRGLAVWAGPVGTWPRHGDGKKMTFINLDERVRVNIKATTEWVNNSARARRPGVVRGRDPGDRPHRHQDRVQWRQDFSSSSSPDLIRGAPQPTESAWIPGSSPGMTMMGRCPDAYGDRAGRLSPATPDQAADRPDDEATARL
jgi:hypothetical protein